MKSFVREEWLEALDAFVLILALLVGSRIPLGPASLPIDLLMVVLGVYILRGLLRRLRFGIRGFFREDSRFFLIFMGVLVFWLFYSCGGLVLSPYTNMGDGFRAVYHLAAAIGAMFCTYDCCRTHRRTKIFMGVLGVVCGVLLLAALAENFVGFHFPGSKYKNPRPVFDGLRQWPGGLFKARLFPATLYEHNPNDLSATVAILLPSLFITGEERSAVRALKILLVLAGLYGMIVNDANLAVIGMLVSVTVYVLLCRRGRGAAAITALGSFALAAGAASYITRALKAVKAHFWTLAESASSSYSSIAVAAVTNIANIQVNAGSVRSRWRLILDAFDMTISTNFLGVGPAGYHGWYEIFGRRTRFSDPHCWYMEVLSQYGIFVFIGYFGCLVTMYVRMIKAQWKNHSSLYAQVIAMCTTFVFACVAPSSFIGATYSWMLPALCLALLRLIDSNADTEFL